MLTMFFKSLKKKNDEKSKKTTTKKQEISYGTFLFFGLAEEEKHDRDANGC